MELTYLLHSSFLVKLGGKNVLIDPYFSINTTNGEPRPLLKPAMKKENMPKIDLLLISHEHFSNFDKKTIEFFAKRDEPLIVGYESFLKELNANESLYRPIRIRQKLSLKKINVDVVEVHHPHSFYPVGYRLECNGESLLHAGDTDLMDTFNEIKANVALLPIGGNHTMDVVDAVRATKIIKPDVAIPMAYDTFPHIKADPREFKEKIEKSIIKTKPVILRPGERFEF